MTMIVTNTKFQTWKTIKLGTQKSVSDLSKALTDNNFRISNWADDILKAIVITPAETEIELVKASNFELGFGKGVATRAQIYARIIELGFHLVGAEVGPQLRLQYSDQPFREQLWIAMDPISDSEGIPGVFGVICISAFGVGKWLGAHDGGSAISWGAEHSWVFARHK